MVRSLKIANRSQETYTVVFEPVGSLWDIEPNKYLKIEYIGSQSTIHIVKGEKGEYDQVFIENGEEISDPGIFELDD